MKFNKISLTLLCIILSSSVEAGIAKLTIHSRANCVNNESISWHSGTSYWLLTVSDHLFHGYKHHSLASGWENTWRSANVHWGESPYPLNKLPTNQSTINIKRY